MAAEVAELVAISLDHPHGRGTGFTGTAVLAADAARQLGALGYVARASGVDIDARRDHPFVDRRTPGSACRRRDRATSWPASWCAPRRSPSRRPWSPSLAGLPARRRRSTAGPGRAGRAGGPGAGVVEAWRGTLCHRVELDADGRLARVKVVDPSFFNWPALPVALADTIVPDFPLANKSFNQSYAGNDL